MEEQVKISNVQLSEGKVSFMVELTPDAFWNRQIKINQHCSIIKRGLADSLKHDAPYDRYVSLVPEFGKIEVSALDEHFRKYNHPVEACVPVKGLSRHLEEMDCEDENL